MTREPGFFKSIYLKLIRGQTEQDCFSFSVPIRCAKFKIRIQFESYAPIMVYQHHDQKSCCFGSFASDSKASNQLDD